MFCFWCVWGRPNIKDQRANVSNVSAAETAAELDQLTANQSVNLSTCQPKATPPVNYKPMGSLDASSTNTSTVTSILKLKKSKSNIDAGLCSPNSSSCPQLTVEEPTESYHSEEETEHSQVSSRIHEARKPFKSASNKQIKTYSFRRMLSFRGSLRGPGGRRSNSGTSDAAASATGDSASSSPGLQPQHRPLQFSFLGQIYKTRSTKRQQQQRRSSSQKVRQHSNSHLHPSVDDLNDIDDIVMTTTQA